MRHACKPRADRDVSRVEEDIGEGPVRSGDKSSMQSHIEQRMCHSLCRVRERAREPALFTHPRFYHSAGYCSNHLTSASCMQSTELLGVFILCPQMDVRVASFDVGLFWSQNKRLSVCALCGSRLRLRLQYLPFPNFKSAFPYAHNSKRDPNWNMMAKSTFFLPNQP